MFLGRTKRRQACRRRVTFHSPWLQASLDDLQEMQELRLNQDGLFSCLVCSALPGIFDIVIECLFEAQPLLLFFFDWVDDD